MLHLLMQLAASGTSVILLGTGMPRPNPEASGPATAVVVGNRTFLFDAGPGVMRQLAAAKLPINGVSALFISHLHSDHTLGLPDLLLTSWVMGRKSPLLAFGPHGLRAMTDHIFEAWKEDIVVRETGLEKIAPGGYRADVREISSRVLYDSGGVRISAIPVLHGKWEEAYGFRIETPGRVIVISGDTRYSPELQAAARGADILIHEAYPEVRLAPEKRPGGELWPEYMRQFHTSDVEVGRLAAAARPKLLILHHLVRMQGTDTELLDGVRRGGFQGRTVIGRDLERY